MGKSMEPSAVRSVFRELARRSSAPVWNRLWPRVEDIADRAASRRAAEAEGKIRTELVRLGDDVRRELAQLREEIAGAARPLSGRIDWVDNVLARMGPHVAAVDERVGTLENTRGTSGTEPVDAAEAAQARTLVEEVRAEHAKVRARLTAIARYEERISRLEELVAAREDQR